MNPRPALRPTTLSPPGGLLRPAPRPPLRLDTTLIETSRRPLVARFLTGASVAFLTHVLVIAAIVYATVDARRGVSTVRVDTTMVYLDAPRPAPSPPVAAPALEVPLQGFQTVSVPTLVPADIPRIDLAEHFDPRDFSGKGVEGGRATGAALAGNEVYTEATVDEQPELLATAPPPYPALLKEAGIQGRVIVEAIVDTTGHAEPASIKVLRSSNIGFERPVIRWIQDVLFRPARRGGRPVRVVVNLPVDFSLTSGD